MHHTSTVNVEEFPWWACSLFLYDLNNTILTKALTCTTLDWMSGAVCETRFWSPPYPATWFVEKEILDFCSFVTFAAPLQDWTCFAPSARAIGSTSSSSHHKEGLYAIRAAMVQKAAPFKILNDV